VGEYDVAMMMKVPPKATEMTLRQVAWRPQAIAIPYPLIIKTTPPPLEIELCNITFAIRQGEERVLLESPQWPSLRAHGENAADAISNMLSVIQEVAQEYVFAEESTLTNDALGFRRFLIQKLLA